MFATEGAGDATEQAFPLAVVAELQADVAVLAILQVIGRVLGDEGNHAAECVRAVQRAGRSAHDLHALERVQIGEVAVGVGERADVEAGRHGDAIGLDAHAIAIQAADADAAEAETGGTAADRQARLVADQILDVLHQMPVHLLAVDHIDGGRDIAHCPLGAGGGDLHPIELARVGRGIGSSMGGQRQGHPQGNGKGSRAGHRHRSVRQGNPRPPPHQAGMNGRPRGREQERTGRPPCRRCRQEGGRRATRPRYLVRISLSLLV
ncbi:hypothetical protein D3C73_955580 [compost metagenome]